MNEFFEIICNLNCTVNNPLTEEDDDPTTNILIVMIISFLAEDVYSLSLIGSLCGPSVCLRHVSQKQLKDHLEIYTKYKSDL